MKMENKILLRNKYMFLSGIAMFLFMFVCFAIFSEYFKTYFFGNPGRWVTREKMMEMLFDYESYMVEGYSLMQMIAPLFPVLAICPFSRKRKCFLSPCIMDCNARPLCLAENFEILLLDLPVPLWRVAALSGLRPGFRENSTSHKCSPGAVQRDFGQDFYNNHMFVYFMLENFVKFFVFGFAYALFAMSLSFLLKKRYQLVLVPLLYFDGLTIIVSLFNRFDGINLFFLAPNYVVMSNAAPSMGTWTVFMPLVPVVLFSVLVIRHKLKNGDDPTDV